jgi:ubiquinone/menaquinone biosynthesis C-methylase UbiE
MFTHTAAHYDALYEIGKGKDYAAEAELFASLLPEATSLLDVACGTGLHLQHLAQRYDCVGVDLDAGMLGIARQRCPDVPLVQADMVDFDLDRTFDAVVCLFSSIGYVRTEARLQQAVATMARHLTTGGTLVVEPFLSPQVFLSGHVHALHVDEPGRKITRMSVSTVEDGCGVMDFHYLIGTEAGVEHTSERHVLGLFTLAQYRHAFERAGLATTVDATGGPEGRGLLTGRS